MNDKPKNVLLAEAIGLTVECPGGLWRIVIRDESGCITESLRISDYEHYIDAAMEALEAWRKKNVRADFNIESYETGYEVELWRGGCLVASGNAESLPAAIVAAILNASEKS